MPNTIAENLQRLQNARTAISTAITNKGGTVPTGAGFEDFPTAINTIAGNTATITSTPPISFRSNGEPLVDWEIEGSNDVGRNLFNATIEQGSFNSTTGEPSASLNRVRSTFGDTPLPSGTYTISARGVNNVIVYVYDETKAYQRNSSFYLWQNNPFTFEVSQPSYVRFAWKIDDTAQITPADITDVMLNTGSSVEPFEPYQIGVGERTKNLVNLAGVNDRTTSGVTFHVDAEAGTVTITGDGSNTDQVQGYTAALSPVTETTNLYMTGYEGNISGVNIYVWDGTTSTRPKKWDGVTSSSAVSRVTREVEIQLLPEHKYDIHFRVNAEFTSSGETLTPMLRLPNTSADFIPYGYEIPVTCGGKTTDIFIGDSPLTADESITKAEANVDIPTLNGDNTLVVDTVAQPDSVTIQYYNYVAGIPYNTDGLCLYFASDIGRVRIAPQTDYEPDVSSLNSAPHPLTQFDDTTIEVRFTMPENFLDKARLIELGNHDGMILALNLNQDNIEVCANDTWAESFSTTFTGGETHTLSVTIGSGNIKIYVDGVYVEADTYTTFTVAGPIIAFANGGAIGMDTRWFPTNSNISKVRVYDRVLTAAEIAANYQIDNPT